MAGSKTIQDPQFGEVVLRKSTRCRRISIRIHPVKGISVTMPYAVPYAVGMAFFQSKRDWVASSVARTQEKLAKTVSPSPEEVESMRKRAKETLPQRLAELAARYGFIYNKVTIKNNATNWGSCSSKGNINLNLKMIRLPQILQDYVLIHELCHLRHHDHGHGFHLLLEHVCTDNLLRAMDAGDNDAAEIAQRAARSKARYPVDHVCTGMIRKHLL